MSANSIILFNLPKSRFGLKAFSAVLTWILFTSVDPLLTMSSHVWKFTFAAEKTKLIEMCLDANYLEIDFCVNGQYTYM